MNKLEQKAIYYDRCMIKKDQVFHYFLEGKYKYQRIEHANLI